MRRLRSNKIISHWSVLRSIPQQLRESKSRTLRTGHPSRPCIVPNREAKRRVATAPHRHSRRESSPYSAGSSSAGPARTPPRHESPRSEEVESLRSPPPRRAAAAQSPGSPSPPPSLPPSREGATVSLRHASRRPSHPDGPQEVKEDGSATAAWRGCGVRGKGLGVEVRLG